MALTLDATLATAQDSLTRKPICEIISTQFINAIPFDGQYFNFGTDNETKPAVIYTAAGKIACVFIDEDGDKLNFLVSDTDLTQWSEYEIVNETNYTIQDVSLVELANGTQIGVIFIDFWINTYRLQYMVINQSDGSVATSPTTIASYIQTTATIDDVTVERLRESTGDYVLIYKKVDISADPDEYYLMKRVSSGDFASWGAEAAITLTGLDVEMAKRNPDLIQASTGQLLLHFDYVDEKRGDGSEIINVYHSTSDDDGATWSAPAQVTTNTEHGYSSVHPVAAEDSGGQIKLVYHDETNVLHADDSTTGWCTSSNCALDFRPTDLHYDPTNNKLYVYDIYNSVGYKTLCSINVIDVATWTVEKCYSDESTPAFNTMWTERHAGPHRAQGDGYYAAVACTEVDSQSHVLVVNHDSETVTEYNFDTWAAYGMTANIDVDFRGAGGHYIKAIAVDADNDKLYVLMMYGYIHGSHLWFGYIDLTETADPATGKYSWHEILYSTNLTEAQALKFTQMRIYPDVGYAIIDCGNQLTTYKGRTWIIGLASGATIKDYNVDDHSGYPYHGLIHSVYYDGKLYGSFHYESGYGQTDRYGMCQIDLTTDAITYTDLSFETQSTDLILNIPTPTGDGKLFWTTYDFGIVLYNISTGAWTVYNNTSLPGLSPDSGETFEDIEYDPNNRMVFATRSGSFTWNGALAFSEDGAFKQTMYRTGTYGVAWTFDAEATLTIGMFDYDPGIVIDSDDVLWCLWTRFDNGTEYSLKWDKSDAEKELTEFLTGPVEATWQVEACNMLKFSCAKGYLFDPNNTMSTYSMYLQRGRLIDLRFGENISGVEYWENQGTFVVEEAEITYARGRDPIVNVTCTDLRKLWSEGIVVASEYYDNDSPENVLDDILQTHAGLIASQIDIPAQDAFTNSHKIWHQWVETSIEEMIKMILDHFGYIPLIDMDGKFTVKEIDLDKSVDHTYSSNTVIVDFTPDSAYSTFVNRVIVRGEGRNFVEVLFSEESLGTINGTLGWWGCDEYRTFYYSEDHARSVRDVRLVVVEPPTINFLFGDIGGGSYSITSEDADEKYCVIYVSAPNLIGAVIATVAAILATGARALGCDRVGMFGGGFCGFMIFALSIELQILAYLLGAVANYSFEIYGRPVGHEKQTFQAAANDTDLQTTLNGLVIPEEIDDPLCYTWASCSVVAEQEMDIVKAQRRRVKFSKVAHLQDEVCDVIRVYHPYSTGLAMDVFVTSLRRVFSKPDAPGNSGHFLDYIEGWRLS